MTPSENSIIVGVPLKGFAQWGGGIDIIRLILEGLLHDPKVKVIALIPRTTWIQRVRAHLRVMVERYRAFSRGTGGMIPTRPPSPETIRAAIEDFLPRISVHFYGDTPRGLVAALQKCGATVALPCFEPMPQKCPVPWVGYLYDFQHRHLPKYFSDTEQMVRDLAFSVMTAAAPAMICNSETVLSDAERFFPNSSARIVSLPFAPVPRAEWFDLDALQAQIKYGIPRRYFIVCNQFWIHKDHPTAIKAYSAFLSLSQEQGVDLVCTGGLEDYRAPSYIESIRDLISQLGLQSRVHLLGRIPKNDQIALLQGAIALLQPTLFEGGSGGGAVYDAVALGVPALVSDIEVNREIDDPYCRFFKQGDPASLATLMIQAAESEPCRATREELLAKASGMVEGLHGALKKAIQMALHRPGLS